MKVLRCAPVATAVLLGVLGATPTSMAGAASPPPPPTNGVVERAASNSVTLSWTASTDPTVESYMVVYGTPVKTPVTPIDAITIGGLTPGTLYTFNVYALSPPGGNSLTPLVISATTSTRPLLNVTAPSNVPDSTPVTVSLAGAPNSVEDFTVTSPSGAIASTPVVTLGGDGAGTFTFFADQPGTWIVTAGNPNALPIRVVAGGAPDAPSGVPAPVTLQVLPRGSGACPADWELGGWQEWARGRVCTVTTFYADGRWTRGDWAALNDQAIKWNSSKEEQ